MADEDQTANDYLTPLPEDHDKPFGPPDDVTDAGSIDSTHQATDSASDIDAQQVYDEGLAGAAEVSEPNADSVVESYDPEADQRQP